MQTSRHFKTSMSKPQSDLFGIFLIDLADPFPPTSMDGNRFLLICVEPLTGWPIVDATKNATAEVVVRFLNEKIIPPFRSSGVFLSNTAACFRAQGVQNFSERMSTKWKIVIAYAPVLNEKLEKMVEQFRIVLLVSLRIRVLSGTRARPKLCSGTVAVP